MVVAPLKGVDVILCQITSQAIRGDGYSLPLVKKDFAEGGLRKASNVRPNRLFTADSNVILYRAGQLKPEKIREVLAKVVEIIEAP